MEAKQIIVGRLVESSISGFTFACTAKAIANIELGALVRANISDRLSLFSLIENITWPGDAMVAQLAQSPYLDDAIIQDNQSGRGNLPLIQVINVGYQNREEIFHVLAPQPASSLTEIYLCTPNELAAFTQVSFAYLRLILLTEDKTHIADLIAAHLIAADYAHRQCGEVDWTSLAARRLARLLRNDYDQVMDVFEAISVRVPLSHFHE
jgi:hypothetical protein